MCPEYRCWYNLLRKTDAVLQTGWGSTTIDVPDGIKQGAIGSPAFFSFLAESCLHEAASHYIWSKQAHTGEGLDLDNLPFNSLGMEGIETRFAQ